MVPATNPLSMAIWTGSPADTLRVKLLSMAQARHADQYGLGAGNWAGGEVTDGSQVIGRISFNGRFWPLDQPN